MEIVKGILVILHIIGFAAIFGTAMSQMTNVKKGSAIIPNGMIHGLTTMFVTGLLLVAMAYMIGDPVNNAKITVKLAVLIGLTILVLVNRKKSNVAAGVLGGIAGLSVLNVAIAVLWH